MMTIRRSNDRGLGAHGWLNSRHTFSFADYHDPAHMGFSVLRVINEDRIAGGRGFGAHPHRDMEIISYVIAGSLAHQDSLGNQAVIRPGEVQRMSAGTGVVHAEMNHEAQQETHFFQIWILPQQRSVKPGYGQKDFSAALASGKPVLVVSKEGRDGSISINQDADLYVARLAADARVEQALRPGRKAWVQVVAGELQVNGELLKAGDGAALTGEAAVRLATLAPAEVLVFDLPS